MLDPSEIISCSISVSHSDVVTLLFLDGWWAKQNLVFMANFWLLLEEFLFVMKMIKLSQVAGGTKKLLLSFDKAQLLVKLTIKFFKVIKIVNLVVVVNKPFKMDCSGLQTISYY